MAKRPKPAIHKKRQNRFSMILASTVVLALLIVVAIGSYRMSERLAAYQEREAELIEQIAAEHERAAEIEEQSKYTQTMKYIEETARKRLGLIYPGEQIFRRN